MLLVLLLALLLVSLVVLLLLLSGHGPLQLRRDRPSGAESKQTNISNNKLPTRISDIRQIHSKCLTIIGQRQLRRDRPSRARTGERFTELIRAVYHIELYCLTYSVNSE